jgi:predicted alpha/beta-fold hydrolase
VNSGAPARGTWALTPFLQPWWLPGGHTQTLAGKLLRPKPIAGVTAERIDTSDGDFLDLAWMPETDPAAPIVLVLHGLEGHTRRGYVIQIFQALSRQGLRPLGLNFRGCSGEINKVPRFYHSGETEDVAFVVDLIRDRFPGRPIMAVGFSLGANILLKLLGEQADRGEAPISAAAAISVPYDLSAGADALEQGWMARFYTKYFVTSLMNKVRAKEGLLKGLLDLTKVSDDSTIRTFDDVVTAPLHGFVDAEDYYRQCSSKEFVARITTPTLLLHALNDPFLPSSAIPLARIAGNPNLTLVLTERGGHVGFVEGAAPWKAMFWAERAAASFLSHHSQLSTSQ